MIRSKTITYIGGSVICGMTLLAPAAMSQTPPAPQQGVSQAPGSPAIPVQPRAEAANPAPNYSLEDLAYLLAPIALYPDPLIALVLGASTFPVQVVEADEWTKANPRALADGNFSQVDAKPWDSSVQALTRFPEQIAMLAEHLEWSQSLGAAFAYQPQDVSNAIQMLRAKAEAAGNLKTTPQQIVEVREESGVRTIYIAPANPERIYVPRYDSSVVFDAFVPGALIFATGVLVGSAWNSRWGWNNRSWNQVWITPPVWNPPPPNWRPGPNVRPPAIWRPGAPGQRPERPGLRPDRPAVRPPERPGASLPQRPPISRPGAPGANRPERPAALPDRPSTGANRPNVQRPQQGQRPGQNARPNRPVSQPPRVRPQQAARPKPQRVAPQARPAQQRVRPQQKQRPQPARTRPQPSRR